MINDYTLKKENIVRTSSSKPMSIIRSASSIQRYLHTLNLTIFLSSMSINLPGVATIICTPLKIMIIIYYFLIIKIFKYIFINEYNIMFTPNPTNLPITSNDSETGTPPIAKQERISGQPVFLRLFE